MSGLIEQRQYYVVTFPYFYSYENGKVVIKHPRRSSSYCDWISLWQRGILPAPNKELFLAGITPAICLKNITNDSALLYLVYLESQGMPFDKNQFIFDRSQIFLTLDDAYQFSIKLNVWYAEYFRLLFLEELAQRREREEWEATKKLLKEIAEDVLHELAEEGIKFTFEKVVEYFQTGTVIILAGNPSVVAAHLAFKVIYCSLNYQQFKYTLKFKQK